MIICPACRGERCRVFYQVEQAPVHSVLLIATRAEALNFPTGEIQLAFCDDCGFIFNAAFDAAKQAYSERYEETQGFSPTFNAFHRSLAQRLIDRYDLRGKTILEIGCGKGEFLTLLCQLGGNRGVGFDPAYIPERNPHPDPRITFVRDFYSETYAGYEADFVVCKMTLEHIPDVLDFVSMVRRTLAAQPQTMVFFQVPEMRRILRDLEFVDIYYEHCSYFSAGSLARLFRRAGFEALDLWTAYEDQYLMIEARPALGDDVALLRQEDDLEDLRREVRAFEERVPQEIAAWRERLDRFRNRRERVVLWGGGSKAVAFLTTLGVHYDEGIEVVVDINPYKQGTFLARTGQEIVGPEFLRDYRPDAVIIMNPIYRQEIRDALGEMGLHPELLVV